MMLCTVKRELGGAVYKVVKYTLKLEKYHA
jgi:hypothetical protein